jgi:large subunit ribosomal protein L11
MANGKKVTANVKMKIEAGKATPAPPVGSILGQHGVNTQEFIQAFNDQTKDMQGLVGVKVAVYEDRTMTFTISGVPTDDLIRRALGIQKGSGVPQKDKVGKLSKAQVQQIAETKLGDMNCESLESAMKAVAGTARSMGVEVEK